ncbi:hypothetical protein SAMN02746041_01328 [Desulfacinum hydrothermale DSM 13146]|uniref:Uncharacterized protein n=1 Tax=Desulfacinum hydrothermale DSM 13146 TaxID=1121390 RepID=A0A1W1XDM5_9BACT|nr:hypothetical protein [Desulfacinum hydrothermale]SMC21952.1 hypothetical protein SAMN02746041_01328 [Desulfacinum hydrothermale DSM 13146]
MPWEYLIVWLVLAVVAVGNGLIRELTYGRRLGELRAHQISSVLAIVFFSLVIAAAHHVRPLASFSQAVRVGIVWVVMTVAFELGFGHYVAGHSWRRLLADYHVLRGRLWPLVLLWIGAAPAFIYLWHGIGKSIY